MKRIFSFTFLALLITTTLALLSFETQSKNSAGNGSTSHQSPQDVSSLAIPANLNFAGENIPFTRFDVREKLDRELLAFSFMHSTTIMLIKKANLYFPIIEPILKKHGIPDDFKYLALIESYFNPRALSPAKAAGIWQFIPETAKLYNMEINDQIDERYDVEKETEAACLYLKESYDMYEDWSVVAASYNGGRARMTRELERQKVNSYYDLFLNEETTRYVFRIIAAKEVFSNPAKYGFHLKKEDFYHTVRMKNVNVSGTVENWADWCTEHGTTYGMLKFVNTWIQDITLDNPQKKVYTVKVPYPEDLNFDVNKVVIHNKAWIE